MKRIFKWIFVIIAALALIIVIAGAVLLLYSPVPEKSSVNVTLEELRALTAQDKDALPVSINALNITDGDFPAGVVVAGYFKTLPVPCYVWQINYGGSNKQNIMVDTGQHKKHFTGIAANAVFHEKEYNLMQNALQRASKIVLTHEHFDHSGGAALSPYLSELLPKLWITPEQKNSSFMTGALFPEGALDKAQALVYERLLKFAPGVVLIKTPGHSEGSQSLYIKLANGKEYLIAGDIAWNIMNINIPKGRPLITRLVLKENRENSANQLRWLNDLQKEGLTILITHDGDHIRSLEKKGLIKFGLN